MVPCSIRSIDRLSWTVHGPWFWRFWIKIMFLFEKFSCFSSSSESSWRVPLVCIPGFGFQMYGRSLLLRPAADSSGRPWPHCISAATSPSPSWSWYLDGNLATTVSKRNSLCWKWESFRLRPPSLPLFSSRIDISYSWRFSITTSISLLRQDLTVLAHMNWQRAWYFRAMPSRWFV